MSPKDKSKYYLWFDTEFTSLELEKARLLQVALIITNHKLERVVPATRDFNCYVRIDPRSRFSAWHREHLSHVLERCRLPSALRVAEINRRLGQYLEEILGPNTREMKFRPMLAGNSLHGDLILARKFLPELARRVHYRLMDVTAVKIQWADWFHGRMFEKTSLALIRKYFKGCGLRQGGQLHDAYYDANASIAELAFYRSRLRRVKSPER